MSERISLSVVVPMYHGEEFLRELIAEFERLRCRMELETPQIEFLEAVFVDDDAIDGSGELVEQLAKKHSWISVVRLSRNYGQHSATAAGLLHTSGDWVATLDEDLQHHPQHLPALLAHAVGERLDVVYAKPAGGVHESKFRDRSSRGVKRVLSWMTGNEHIVKFNSFRLLRGPLARAAASVATERTYFDVALTWFSNRIGTLELPLHDRRFAESGKSGYTVGRLIGHAFKLALGCDLKVLRLGTIIGVAAMLLSGLVCTCVLVKKLFYPELITADGWTSLILAVTFFGGLISTLVGIALEYLSVLSLRALGRPTYYAVDRSKDQLLLQSERDVQTHDLAA